MAKIRLKDLANELGVIYSELAKHAQSELGLEVKGPMTLLEEDVAEKLRNWSKARSESFRIEEKRVAGKVIRRRRVKAPEKQEAPQEQEEELAAEAAHEEVIEEPQAETKPKKTARSKSLKTRKAPEPEVAAPKEQAASPKNEKQKVKDDFRALKVVEQREIAAPEVKDAPVFERPEPVKKPEAPKKVDNRPPEVIAREEASKSDGRGRQDSGRSFGRREVIDVRSMQRPKQFGRKKVATKKGKKTEITTPKASKRVIRISDSVTIGELAKRMGVKVNEVIAKAVGLGLMVTINQAIDADSAGIIASDFGYEVENKAVDAENMLIEQTELEQHDDAGAQVARPPVVTVMGHVDHGKTSLLDKIRKTSVTSGEHGGITQHIGAYYVKHKKGDIVFLDTPGHEAFTAMRARGTSVTDIVILVVAADDGVMPQTRESVNHAKAAGVPIIVAINKIDKPEANPEKVKQELTELQLVPEDWGGDTIFSSVSAHSGQGIDELLDMVLLQAEVMELKANPDRPAQGTIVEAQLDRGRGAVATVLVQQGTLKTGDAVVCGTQHGRIRALVNDRGEKVKEAGPSTPVEVVGLSGVVEVGDQLVVLKDEKKARQIGEMRSQQQRQKELERSGKLTLEDLQKKIESGGSELELKVVLKGDVMGSIEAITESLSKIASDKVQASVIHSAVGGITESDVMLASASNALVIGFNVRPESAIQRLAESEGVEVRLYNVIYDLVEDIKKAMAGLLSPTRVEKVTGRVEVREIFHIAKVGTIGGGHVIEGKVNRNSHVRLLRDNVQIYEGKLSSLKRFKDDAKEVKEGMECGLGVENYNDIKVGDVIEAYDVEQVQQEL